MRRSSSERIIVFLKRLVHGRVKTRLAAHVGDERALLLYRAMIQDLVRNVSELRSLIEYYVDSETGFSDSQLANIIQQKPREQSGQDLGQRMYNAFQQEFGMGADRAVLIGSDIPHLTAEVVEEYLEKLRKYSLVLGPALDGGYYLIGFKRECITPSLFENVPWSSSKVFSHTIRRAREKGIDYYVGREYRDVDTYEDVRELCRRADFRGLLPHLCALLQGES
jgi:rSAM/selenodomain-associated transferase 1